MSIFDRLGKREASRDSDVASEDGLSPVGQPNSVNDGVRKKQQLLLGGVATVLLLGASWWIFGNEKPAGVASSGAKEIKVATGDLVNRNMSEQEWMAKSENRFDNTDNRLRTVDGQGAQLAAMQKEMDGLRGKNNSMSTDGQKVLSAYQTENDQLKSQLATAQSSASRPPAPGPNALYGNGSPSLYQQPGGLPAPAALPREVKTVSFTNGPGGNASRAERGTTVYSDSPDYLPANSFATARVIVGVDASAGVNSQTDPLPVVLRITGPARSVADNGKVLTTKIQGCLINGAARGDLSSEKVYVKLQRMTCSQPGGRYAVSEVKGFIAFGGKSGVRGRVVSREGSLVTQAFLAGIAGGIGRGFSANTNSALQGTNITVDGKRQQLGVGALAQGGLGEGVSTAADTVSKYLIERAEQYQPVIEMPTGIDVEIVFLDGAFVRN